MKWLKILWGYIWKKDIVKQNKVDNELVKKFAKLLDDAIDFNKILKGKFAIIEKYDEWAFTQIINGFILIFANKFGDVFWRKFETCLGLYKEGRFEEASIIVSEDLNKMINTGLPDSAEAFILQRQVVFVLELASKFLNDDFKRLRLTV